MAGWVERRGENKWRLNVPGGTDPDGKRIVYRKNVEAPSKREAEKLLDLFSAEVLKGEYVQPSKLSFKQFVDRWYRDYGEANLELKTLHRYKELLARAIQAFGHIKLEDIKPVDLLAFYKKLQEDGVRKDGKPGGLAARTILHHHRAISAVLQDAVEWQVIPSNPAARVKPPKVKAKPASFYDKEQTAALLAALDQEPFKYKMMVILALATGVRMGELNGLEWSNVDFENSTITVNQAAQYLPGKGSFTKDPKNDTSRRPITVPESVMALLKQYKAHQAEERLKVGDLWQGSNRLFTSFDGRPMFPNTISNWFPKFLARHKLPHVTFHGLRHTNASLLIAAGVNLKNVSARLGHSNVSTTGNIYAHVLKSADQEAAKKLDDILNGNTQKKKKQKRV